MGPRVRGRIWEFLGGSILFVDETVVDLVWTDDMDFGETKHWAKRTADDYVAAAVIVYLAVAVAFVGFLWVVR